MTDISKNRHRNRQREKKFKRLNEDADRETDSADKKMLQ